MTRLLLVEDDRAIASPLIEALGDAGFVVQHETHGRAALAASGYELVLLDLGLPDMDGRDVFRELRTRSQVPVIMLTARGDEFDRVLGLELGADDYVTKPFSMRELLARIRAVLRRSAADSPAAAAEPRDGAQHIGPLTIDRRAHRVFLDGAELTLSAKEFDLLAFLAEDPGAVRTRTDIIEQVWDPHWYGPTKTVDAHVAFLRRKLGAHEWIQSVRGVGFRLEPPGGTTP